MASRESSALEGLVGREYGPFVVPVSADLVARFVDAIGGDAARWARYAPPFIANVALFAAAPAFLEDPAVVPFTRSLIHSEQSYAWSRPLAIGETLAVTGVVSAVRARGDLNLVTFTLAAGSDRGPWLSGTSVFLLASAAAGSAPEESEPPALQGPRRGSPELVAGLPGPGEAISPYPCGASRADLVRYAGACGDWNPIHWDHESARSAGLSGTIVHGLLMAAWMGDAVCRSVAGDAPLQEARVRFRNPLRPGVEATVTGEVGADDGNGPSIEVSLESGGERLASGRFRVTP